MAGAQPAAGAGLRSVDGAKALLEQYGIRPSKGLGQNFLVSERVLTAIIEAANLSRDDIILEIGPGPGLMTKRLAQRAGQVVAVELDQRLVDVLHDSLSDCDNVRVVQGDILDVDPARLLAEATGAPVHSLRYKVVANLPYYITSAVLRRLLEPAERPELMVLTVQYEVAERMVASPGEMSLLAVSVQVYGKPEMVRRVPASAFYPPPKVESAVVRILAHEEPLVPAEREQEFFRVVRAGFSQRRKQLVNSLSGGLGLSRDEVTRALEAAGVEPTRRAQSLSVAEWLDLAAVIHAEPLDGSHD